MSERMKEQQVQKTAQERPKELKPFWVNDIVDDEMKEKAGQ